MGVLEALVAFQFQTKHLQHRMVKPRVKMRGLKKKKELKDRGDRQWSAELM